MNENSCGIEKNGSSDRIEEKSKVNLEKKEKYIYLEVLRIISIFFVIFNHTGQHGFFLFSLQETGSLKFWIYLFLSISCKFAVPMFFAISGAIMLGKENESLKVLWKKRILKYVVVLIIVSLIHYIIQINMNFQKFNIKIFLTTFFKGKFNGYLGFLYSYIAYLVSLPFLRAMVKNLENKHYYYMIIVSLFFSSIVPIIEYLLSNQQNVLIGNIKVTWLTERIIIYPCVGYFLHNKLKLKKPKRTILFLWIASVIGIIIACYMTYYRGKVKGYFSESNSQVFYKCFDLINCIFIYLATKDIFERIKLNKIIYKIILSLGECTIGIYLVHVIFTNSPIFFKKMLIIMRSTGINHMLIMLIWCFLALLASYILVLILRKIPFIKKIVGA